MDVLEYDKITDRYLVREHGVEQKKGVVRLAIMFNEEDPEAFKERVELSK